MDDNPDPRRRRTRERKPLDPARLEELATAYVARFATTAARLRRYLVRKVGERGFVSSGDAGSEGETPQGSEAVEFAQPVIDALVDRFVRSGYVDDETFARARAGGLLRRGYGGRRIDMALREAGVEEPVRADLQPGEAEARAAVLALARKRRFGPFGGKLGGEEDAGFEAMQQQRALREKQLAALVRAGHDFAHARAVIGAETEEAAQEWADEI
jgi:regulatory protein